jgi:hypothetical protein
MIYHSPDESEFITLPAHLLWYADYVVIVNAQPTRLGIFFMYFLVISTMRVVMKRTRMMFIYDAGMEKGCKRAPARL